MVIRIWENKSERQLKAYSLSGHIGEISALSFSPSGLYLASSGEDSVIKIWDTTSGKELKSFSGHSKKITSLQFSPDLGQYLVSSSQDNTIKLWEVSSG